MFFTKNVKKYSFYFKEKKLDQYKNQCSEIIKLSFVYKFILEYFYSNIIIYDEKFNILNKLS